MQEAERVAPRPRQRLPVGARRLEHRERADDVGLDERVAAGDRAIDVALGRQMDHVVGRETLERLGHRAPVADVDPGEAIVRRIVDRSQRLQIAGVGERVDIEHVDAGADEMPAHRRADESRAAGHEHLALHGVPR